MKFAVTVLAAVTDPVAFVQLLNAASLYPVFADAVAVTVLPPVNVTLLLLTVPVAPLTTFTLVGLTDP